MEPLVKNFIQIKMCNATMLTHAAETTLSLLHSDVCIIHATVTLNLAKSRTKIGYFWHKVTFFMFPIYQIFTANFFWNNYLVFCNAKAELDATCM